MSAAGSQAAGKPWRYEASARGPRALLFVGLWWGAVVLGLWLIDLSPVLAVLALAFTLPALWEMLRGDVAWLEVDKTGLRWGAGRHAGEVAAQQIAHVRLDTRLDFSLRARVETTSGTRHQIPYPCVPKAEKLKGALDAAGIAHQHHHFALMS